MMYTATTRNNHHNEFQRLKALLHYVCSLAADPSVLGKVKLNKVPWYADSVSFLRTGKPITGARYIKRQYGPVPSPFMPAIEELEKEGKISRGKVMHFDRMKEEFISIDDPDISMFSAEEIDLIGRAFEHVCLRHTATSVSRETHDDIWELAEIGEEIPLATIFAASLDELTERDVKWAKQELGLVAA